MNVLKVGLGSLYTTILLLLAIGFNPSVDYRNNVVPTPATPQETIAPVKVEVATDDVTITSDVVIKSDNDAKLRTMANENSKQLPTDISGYIPELNMWCPHDSIEGGNDTVGYGHKFTNKEVKHGVVLIGGDEFPITECFTDASINLLFEQDWEEANASRIKWIGDDHPEEVNSVVTEMAYQMGLPTLQQFKKFKKAIEDGDYQRAADEMLDSKWAKQDSPERAEHLSKIVRSLAA